MQKVLGLFDDEVRTLILPDPRDNVMPGVMWGSFLDFFTPAYWSAIIWLAGPNATILKFTNNGRTLKEEAAVCLLSGHGVTGELSFAAYKALRREGIFMAQNVSEKEIAAVLSEPVKVGERYIRYRFPKTKAAFLAPVLNRLDHESPPTEDHRLFRDWFLQFKGIGLKTASFITRNWLNSPAVAILDIHIIRCGLICGFFKPHHAPQSHYLEMEDLFLEFANKINADAAKLDVLIWQHIRMASRIGMRAISKN